MGIDAEELDRLVNAWEERRRNLPQRIQSGMPRNPPRHAGSPTMNRNRSRREMLEARERREVMSVANTFGRLHASMSYLINTNATDSSVTALRAQQERTRGLSSAEINLELIAEMMEGYIQFAQAREDGLIARHASGAWVSVIPRMHDLLTLSSRVSWFADEFDEAVEAQHRDHLRATINECLLTIATELVFWGLGRVVRLVRIPASASRSSRGIVELFHAAKARLVGIPAQIVQAASNLARRLTKGRGGVPIYLCPRTGRTLHGLGPPQNIGNARTLPQNIGHARTLPQDIGHSPTLPAGRGTQARPAPAPLQSIPSSRGRMQGPGNIEFEMLTADEGRGVIEFIRSGGMIPNGSVSFTWGSSRVMLESYGGKWIQYGMRGAPPPHGFRVYDGDRLLEVVAHLDELEL